MSLRSRFGAVRVGRGGGQAVFSPTAPTAASGSRPTARLNRTSSRKGTDHAHLRRSSRSRPRRAGLLGLLAALLAAASPASAADTTPPALTLDGGMFIKVGSVLSSSDSQTATLPMNITWSTSDNVGMVSQTAWLSAAGSDEGPFLPEQEKQLGGAARQATFTNLAHASNTATDGGVRVYDAAGNETDGSWA